MTPASFSSFSSSVSGRFLPPNIDEVLNKSEDRDVDLGLCAMGAVDTVVSDLDLLAAPKKVLSVDLLLAGFEVEVVEIDDDDDVNISGSTGFGVVAIDAFPEDKELYVPDFDDAAAVAFAMMSAIIS